MNEHVIGLDIGDVRIGIAVSDGLRMIASPLEVLTRVGWGPDTRHIKALCDKYETTEIVSGLPLNMDGTAGFQSQKVKQFCGELEKAGLTVYYQDERLTTVTAENALLEDDMGRKDRKRRVDKVAAALILQQWLDTRRNEQQALIESEEQMMSDKDLQNLPEENGDEDDSVIELLDEDGNTVPFEHLATVEHEGEYYIVLLPQEEEENEADDEDDGEGVVIMKIDKDEKGEDCYTVPEDDALVETVFEKFLSLMQEDEDYEVGEEPEDGD